MPDLHLDTEKIDEVVLALLLLGLHEHNRVGKTFDWNALDRLHAKGLISDPRGKAKSVMITDAGQARAEALLTQMFERT
jgi:hypothetical protein